MAPKSTPAQLDDAIRDYLAGEGCEAVSARHRVSTDRLRAALIDGGHWRTRAETYALSSKRVSATLLAKSSLPTDDLVERYGEGESVNALAKSFGVSRRTIEYRLKAAGVTIRGTADANRLMMASRSPEENRRSIAAAHVAVRGSKRTPESLVQAAATREASEAWVAAHTSPEERQVARWVEQRGLTVVPQKAIGPYNVDFTAGPVAVEVFGGGWHQYGAARRRTAHRLGYILDEGWHLMIVWAINARWPVNTLAADQIVAFAQSARRDPSGRGQYRVIWGDGQPATPVGDDLDDLAVKPSRSGRKSPRPRDHGAGD